MSRRDTLHFALRRTLEKDGWTITSDPLILELGQTILKADLGAEKIFTAEKEGRKIAIEVKDFDSSFLFTFKNLDLFLENPFVNIENACSIFFSINKSLFCKFVI